MCYTHQCRHFLERSAGTKTGTPANAEVPHFAPYSEPVLQHFGPWNRALRLVSVGIPEPQNLERTVAHLEHLAIAMTPDARLESLTER